MLVIGSVALERALARRGELLKRVPADMDVICSHEEMRRFADRCDLTLVKTGEYKWRGFPRALGQFVEFEMLEKSESGYQYIAAAINYMDKQDAYDYAMSYPDDVFIIYAPLEVLYSIKLAHRHYPRAWKKHAEDRALMELYLKEDVIPQITAIREKETQLREGKLKTPSLNKTAEDFFNDKVSNKIFIHDDIHAVMAHREKPMFEYFKKDGAKVACSREKFEALPMEHRLQAVMEEAYVIALERIMLPMLFAGGRPQTADKAFDWAIMRICTNLCSGWFREFATHYYPAIIHQYNKKYVEKFLDAYEDGKIRLIGEAHVEKASAQS